jgi:signal transduction histidine kinase
MGELASGLAHELNQPLCAISSYAESALQLIRPDDPGVEDLLQKIIHQAERTTQIIQRLRDFVRKQSPKPSPMDAQTLIKEVIQFVEPERRRRHICVSVRVPENLDRICADRIQIGQVLLNLVTNAMQAMQAQPEDQRRLSLVVSRETPGELQFCLCNSGQPVAAEHIGQLFTPFYTTKENGMGMGLAISRTIIEAHGGQISYSDNPAGGACFRFSLPTVS